jgi:N-acetylglucosaminyl-diphospho-decaprenol L-rhamnosyltransferase
MRILTVHFNTPELTTQLVRDFPRYTPHGRAVSIHILDNSSTPGNLRTLRAGIDGLERVTLDVNKENIGFGEGMNLLATSDVIDESDILWLLNPDTRLREGCLENLEDQLVSVDFDVVSPLIYSGDDTDPRIWYCGGSISTSELSVRHLLYGCHLSEAPHHSFETEFITGAAPMMRASIFRAVGGFPHGYFLYWEDVLLSWRARDLGFRLGVVPSAHLWHAVGAASGSGQSRTFYYWSARNRFTFARDVGIPRRRLIFGRGGLHSLRTVAKALLEREGRLPKTNAAIRGTFDGLRQGREQKLKSLGGRS